MKDIAIKYYNAGLSVVPVSADKIPTIKWKERQSKLIQPNGEFDTAKGVAIVAGEVSGGLECLDIDLKYDISGTLMDRFKALIKESDAGLLKKLLVEKTTNGGYHFIYRYPCEEKRDGNLKLASRYTTEEERSANPKETVLILLETRGEGGYFVAAPSAGYEIIQGDFNNLPLITTDERNTLIACARALDEVKPDVVKIQVPKSEKQQGLSPFEDYNKRGDLLDFLISEGWSVYKEDSKNYFLKRPGKENKGKWAATLRKEDNVFYVFSKSVAMEFDKAYSPSSVYIQLKHNGDVSAAAKDLLAQGYGEKMEYKKPERQKEEPKISSDENDLSFLAPDQKIIDYVNAVYTNTLQLGLPTGIPPLDDHFRFKRGSFNIIGGHDNVGKALSLDTPIPTPSGWTTMGDIKIGDKVFDESGLVCNVVGVSQIQHNRNVYLVKFSNGEKIKADEEHLWSVRSLKGGNGGYNKKSIMSTKELIDSGVKVVFKNRVLNNHSINLPKPIELPDSQLSISPYLLGVWLGDGKSSGADIACGESDLKEMLEIFDDEKIDYAVKRQQGKCPTITIKPRNFLVSRLREMNLYNNKHIPNVYLRASKSQRLSLLQGLMDTDGYASKDGRCEFCTKREVLKNGFAELLSSLGIKYSVCEKTPSINGVKMNYVAYYINFSATSDMPVFRIKRKLQRMSVGKRTRGTTVQIVGIEKIDSEPVKCIKVDSKNSLYLCGKTMIPTHNTAVILYLLTQSAILHNWKWFVVSVENSAGYIYRKLMEYYLCKPVNQMSEQELFSSAKFVKAHFFIVDNEDSYSYVDILAMSEKMKKKHNIDGVLIDPYNAVEFDEQQFKLFGDHNYHYKVTTEFRKFCKKNDCCIYVNCHAVTEALRRVWTKDTAPSTDLVGYPMPPKKSDVEGGGKFANRADDFLIIHRYVQSEEKYRITELHIVKVKEVETGGRQTHLNKPVKIQMSSGNCGFVEYETSLNFITKQYEHNIPEHWQNK